MTNLPLVSIVICTYGAAIHLRKVVQALAVQSCSDFELLVIDNNPVSISWLTSLSRALPAGRVRLIHCPAPGLSNARNLGIKESKGRYIAFLDDDAVPEEDWLKNFLSAIQRYRSVAAGGRVKLVIEGKASNWFLRDYKLRRYLSELFYEENTIERISYPKYIVGANMMFDRQIFDKYGFFSDQFGKKGKRQYFGEETEFLRRLLDNGEKVSYTGMAIVMHVVSAQRARLKSLLKRAFSQGSSDRLVDKIHGSMFPGRPYNPYKKLMGCFGDYFLRRTSRQRLAIDIFRNIGYIF